MLRGIGSALKGTASLFVKCEDSNQQALILGCGSQVSLHCVFNEKRLQWTEVDTQVVLDCIVIHGFRQGCHGDVAVFGQKSVAIINVHLIKGSWKFIVKRKRTQYEDWILNLVWFSSGLRYAVITAHNKVIVADALTGNVISSHNSTLNCILYSAKFLHPLSSPEVNEITDLTVAAGTVFNEVILWRPSENSQIKADVLHRLSGHKGVIFNMSVNYPKRLVCSVSDDRSIRLYCWSYPSEETEISWEAAVFKLMSVFNGHTSRVWDACILDDGLISIGEDALLITWNMDGSMRRQVKTHKGKNIWCMAVNDKYVVTCGGDSSVKAWELPSLLSVPGEELDESEYAVTISPDDPADFPRDLCIVNDICFTITNLGRVIGNCFKNKSEERVLHEDSALSGYTVMSCTTAHPSGNIMVALGNSTGLLRIILLDPSLKVIGVHDSTASGHKIMSLNWLDNGQHLMSVSVEGNMNLFSIEYDSDSSVALCHKHTYYLPKSKQRFLISACSLSDSLSDSYIVCADKTGTLHLYEMHKDPESSTEPTDPVQTLVRTHGKTGITDICVHSEYVYTCGRDGTIKQYSLTERSLQLVNQTKISTQYDWLAKLLFDGAGHVTVGVFHTTEFVLYDMSTAQITFRVDCGGGHRNWDIGQSDDNLLFAYIKDKKTHLISKIIKPPCQTIRPGFHSGKTTCAQIFKIDNRLHLITGGDDTRVIVSQIDHQGSQATDSESSVERLTPLLSVSSHISSVKCCCVCSMRSGKPMVITGGGRAQICIFHISTDTSGDIMTSHGRSIHLSDRSLLTRKQLKTQTPDPEMRIMSVSTLHLDIDKADTHLICAGCSDGTLRLVMYDEKVRDLVQYTDPLYTHTHCILTVKGYPIDTEFKLLLVGATDGQILIFDLADVQAVPAACSRQPIMTMRPHQSGVNAITVSRSDEAVIRVVSGGDDNSICVTFVDLDKRSVHLDKKIANQHSAQITGIEMMGLHRDCFVTGSIDQRIFVWKDTHLHESSDSKADPLYQWQVVDTKHTTVADVSCLTSYVNVGSDESMLVVAGEGIEIYNYSSALQ